jgi:hypothetical protein
MDGTEGGNGITWDLYNSIEHRSALTTEVSRIVSCTNCARYCDECLLLERTPSIYLEQNLLEKNVVRAIIGQNHVSR